MAIAYVTSGGDQEYNTSTTGCQFNLTATGSDQLVILFVRIYHNGAGASWANTPTVGGVAATQIGSDFNLSDGLQTLRAYYFTNPPTSSTAYIASTQTINASRDIEMIAHIYSGASISSVPDSYNTLETSGNVSISTTVVASNCWLVSCLRPSSTSSAGSGTTQRQYPSALKSGDTNGTVGTGSQSMNWNSVGTSGSFIVSIAPVASASTNSNFFAFM